MEKQGRQVNYEALRILAMLMVISMHYLQKGGLLIPVSEDAAVVNAFAWLIETLCIGAANVYVLIGGYFLVEAAWKWQKLLALAVQVWVYSVGIPLLCLMLNIGNVADWTLYDWTTVILPLQSEHYWFATAYIGLYLFVPVLQAGVKRLNKKQFQILLCFLLLFFSLIKSLWPLVLPTDRYGYDFGWFICLFLVAAYIRLYGMDFLSDGKKAWGLYLAGAALIWLFGIGLDILAGKGLPTAYLADMLYSYNHILVLILSVALFIGFSKVKIRSAGLQRWILILSPCTFGVYLLHENIAIRYLWQDWAGIEAVRGSFAFIPHMILTVCGVFVTGALTDIVRQRMVKAAAGVIRQRKQTL